MKIDVLYQDDALIAVDKPPGILVHRSAAARNDPHYMLQLVRDQVGRLVYPVHRLDKPTSGVLLFALDSDTARLIGELFSSGQVSKRYCLSAGNHVRLSIKPIGRWNSQVINDRSCVDHSEFASSALLDVNC